MAKFEKVTVEGAIKRLKELLGYSTNLELCNFFNVSKNTINMWRQRHTLDISKIYHTIPNISIDWLLTGQGVPYITNTNKDHSSNLPKLPIYNTKSCLREQKTSIVVEGWYDLQKFENSNCAVIILSEDISIKYSLKTGDRIIISDIPARIGDIVVIEIDNKYNRFLHYIESEGELFYKTLNKSPKNLKWQNTWKYCGVLVAKIF